MRQIGHREPSQPQPLPSAEGLRLAAIHQRTAQTLAALPTTGIVKGIYRFSSHEERNRDDDAALARAMAANIRWRASRNSNGQ